MLSGAVYACYGFLSSSSSRFSSVSGVCTELMYHKSQIQQQSLLHRSQHFNNRAMFQFTQHLANKTPYRRPPKVSLWLAEQLKTRLTLATQTRAIHTFHLKANSLMLMIKSKLVVVEETPPPPSKALRVPSKALHKCNIIISSQISYNNQSMFFTKWAWKNSWPFPFIP